MDQGDDLVNFQTLSSRDLFIFFLKKESEGKELTGIWFFGYSGMIFLGCS